MYSEPLAVAEIVAGSFPKAIGMVYEALAKAGLHVLAESDACPRKLRGNDTRRCKILYVVCPFLLLEALAFQRSAAVYLPAHLVVRGTAGGAEIYWMNPAALPLTLPVGAVGPIMELYSRIAQTFATVSQRSGALCEVGAPG